MQFKRLGLWRIVLLAGIGSNLAIGADAPTAVKKGGNAAPAPAEVGRGATGAPKNTPDHAKAGDTLTPHHEDAIRLTGQAFVKSFNLGDAKACAAHYAANAEYIDDDGNVFQGREAIEEEFRNCFARNPKAKMELHIDSIRVVSPGVAVEDGVTTITNEQGTDSATTRYTAIHAKYDDKWYLASVREQANKEHRQHRSQLQQLSWLQGDWVDEGTDSVVLFTCVPSEGGNFLMRKFTVQVAGQPAMSGEQRIGWDPISQKLRTWVFDSEGGHADGFWFRDDDRWILKSTGVTADGQTASGTSVYTPVSATAMTWQLIDHEIGGVRLPDSEVVTIVRRAPAPEAANDAVSLKSK